MLLWEEVHPPWARSWVCSKLTRRPKICGLLFAAPFTVALVERGNRHSDVAATHTLIRWCHASHTPNNQSNQIHTGRLLNRRLIDVSVGKGLGGTTNINAGLVIPPARDDFAQWPAEIRDKIMDSVETVVSEMHANGCITLKTPKPPTMIETKLPVYYPNQEEGELWKETRFPSICLHVPCAAGKDKNI
jgi:choline dehydrogenase-like flavoprotein